MNARQPKTAFISRLPLFPALVFFGFLTLNAGAAYTPNQDAPEVLASDSTEEKEQIKADSNFIFDYIAHPILRIVTWPIETFLVPVVETAFLPAKPPLEYIFEENVLDRAIDLVSFGPGDQIFLYPVVVISTGTRSLTGLTFRHRAPFGRSTERFVSSHYFFVNGDMKIRTRLYLNQFAGSRFNLRFNFLKDDVRNARFPPPRTDSLRYYSNHSIGGDFSLSHPLVETLWLEGMFRYRNRKFGPPPTGLTYIRCGTDGPFLASPTCLDDRGINQRFHEKFFRFGILSNTIDNENIPTRGSKIDAWWEYCFVSENRDYHKWEAIFQKFFFLGIERYEITPKEQRKLGVLTFKKIKQTLQVSNLRKRIFKRKVIVMQLKAAKGYEVYQGRAPLFSLHTLSNSTPMRGYTASPFHDFSLAAVSLEYRFPIMRLMEGTLFNEYGWVGKQFNDFSTDRLRNSWGLGVRLARKDLFLFRAQIGFHGLNAPVSNITVDTAY